jgi:hypothetical protein
MFNFKDWINTFNSHRLRTGTIYNDAVDYGVSIESVENRTWRVLGIHHLTSKENKASHEEFGKHNLYIEMLCKQGDRDGFRAIHWTWGGRRVNEPANPVFAGQKGPDELIDLPLNLGMVVSVWTQGSEIAKGFSSDHPDEGNGNTIGHHSFFVCFQEIDENEPMPEPEPEPPTPEPQETVMLIKKSWLDSQEIDEDGYIRISC